LAKVAKVPDFADAYGDLGRPFRPFGKTSRAARPQAAATREICVANRAVSKTLLFVASGQGLGTRPSALICGPDKVPIGNEQATLLQSLLENRSEDE
jgi:hypothetical protein